MDWKNIPAPRIEVISASSCLTCELAEKDTGTTDEYPSGLMRGTFCDNRHESAYLTFVLLSTTCRSTSMKPQTRIASSRENEFMAVW
jgi:hypothetical protein